MNLTDFFAGLLAQAEAPVRQSYLAWMYHSLGFFYAVVIPLAALMVFLGACLVVAMSRRPAVIAAYLVFLPLPLLIGLYGTIEGFIAVYSVIVMSPTAPKPAELARR
jgi:hypothetical protein